MNSLTLEWNSIGLSERGMEALSNALITNKSIRKVDLRNNRIGSNAAVYLNDIIRHNASIELFDLRWNEIGTDGARQIINALQSNKSILQLELAGNNVSEDTLILLSDSIRRKKKVEIIQTERSDQEIFKQMFTPSKTAPNFSKNIVIEDNSSVDKVRLLDIKTRYDAELIERERTERKLGEAAQQLNQEREKNTEMREELLKAVDTEKAVPII